MIKQFDMIRVWRKTMKEKTTNSSGSEGRQLTVKFKQITDFDLKVKYIKESIFAQISDEEIQNSEVWAMLIDETEKMLSLATVIKDGERAEITHMSCTDTLLKQNAFMDFYLFIESYYVNNGIKSLCVGIPEVKSVTPIIKFFKRAGFKKIANVNGYTDLKGNNSKSKQTIILLFKADLE